MTKEAIRYVKDGWSSSTEDRNLENVLKNPENYVDSYSYGLRIVQMLRQKAFRDGYNAGAKELQEENDQLKA